MSSAYIEPIPDGWEMRLDETTQTYYFIDHNNQRTQWHHPVSNLIYRPTEANARSGRNGYGSTPISVNRNPTAKPTTMHNHHNQPAPSTEPEPKVTVPVPKPSQEPEEEPVVPAAPKKSENGFDRIANVLEKAKPLTEEVNTFNGVQGDKNYLRLMECLDVLIIELDGIGVDGLDEVRSARRNAVKQLQQVIEMLEYRASINSGDDKPMSDSHDAVQSTSDSSNMADKMKEDKA